MWVYSHSANVLGKVGLQIMEEHICRLRNIITNWIATRPLFADCWEGERLQGTPPHIFWWEQEFDLDLEALNSEPGSDGLTASKESWGSREVGLGG